MTPLQMAASYGYVDICHILLSRGANVMAVDQESSTPLNLAAATGHVQICRKLLEEAKLRDNSLVTRVRNHILVFHVTDSSIILPLLFRQAPIELVQMLFVSLARQNIQSQNTQAQNM